MGIPMGFAEGLFVLSFWRLARGILHNDKYFQVVALAETLLGFAAVAIYTQYIDKYVLPNHNLNSTSGKKVLFVHVPFVILNLLFLEFYQSSALSVVAITMAQVGAVFGQRFPPPWDNKEPWPTPPPDDIENLMLNEKP